VIPLETALTCNQRKAVSLPQVHQLHPEPELRWASPKDPDRSGNLLPLIALAVETLTMEFSLVGIVGLATPLALLDAAFRGSDGGGVVDRKWLDATQPNN
jgi:hypothetical protein